jgi:hypothetical protein
MTVALKEIILQGNVNTPEDVIRANIARNIRRGLPQVRKYGPNATRVALVGGGPSLLPTFDALRQQAFAGDKLVAVNGSYQWLLERNLKPSVMVMLDARPSNVRFLAEPVVGCKYFLASQCDPAAFDLCEREGRDVTIFHCIGDKTEEDMLKEYYDGRFCVVQCGTTGGTTVMLRSIVLLATLGFFRLDVYGMDSCWLGDAHHAYDQPENDRDRRMVVTTIPRLKDGQSLDALARTFVCDPWHLRQAEEFQTLVSTLGDHFALNVHGDGLLAHILRTGASLPEAAHVDDHH